MKILTKLISFTFSLMLLSACGDSATKDLSSQLKTSYDKDGQQVELVGYLSLGRVLTVQDDKIKVNLDNIAGQSNGDLATVEVGFGKEANGIFIPEKFQSSDLEIYDNAGEKHGYMTKVKITGTVKYTSKDWKNAIDEEIETSESIAENDPMRILKLTSIENKKKAKQRAQEAADKREKETGDPNDYSFYIIGEKIEVAE